MFLTRQKRPGWTVIDVVVLVFVLALAAGLIIPLVIQQRTNAVRLHCAHNLKQLGSAIHNFNKNKGFLPPARIADDLATWAVLIAPYMEKRPADGPDHPLVGWEIDRCYADQSDVVRADYVKQMLCPARPHPGMLSIQGDGNPNVPGAVGDYACVSGDGRASRPWTGANANGPMILGEVVKLPNGVLRSWQGRTKLDQSCLKRGLSVTMLLGEKHVPMDAWGRADDGDGSIYNGGRPGNSARVAGPGFGLAADRFAPFNSNFGSYHPGVCLFLRADLAVHTFTIHVSEDILGRMMVREEE